MGGRTWRLLPEELAGAGDDIARQPMSKEDEVDI
jgi:hypothetical protein